MTRCRAASACSRTFSTSVRRERADLALCPVFFAQTRPLRRLLRELGTLPPSCSTALPSRRSETSWPMTCGSNLESGAERDSTFGTVLPVTLAIRQQRVDRESLSALRAEILSLIRRLRRVTCHSAPWRAKGDGREGRAGEDHGCSGRRGLALFPSQHRGPSPLASAVCSPEARGPGAGAGGSLASPSAGRVLPGDRTGFAAVSSCW